MNKITFPGIGLELNISEIMLSIGSINIYWYGFFIVLSFILGLLVIKKYSKTYSISFENILELFIIILISAIVGARLYYILFNLDYYSKHLNEIFMINSGGLAIYGGIMLSTISIFVYSKIKKINFVKLLDLLVLALPLGQAIGRWGNFFNVEAYGSITTNIFRMGIIENGKTIYVHPTFLYEFIGCLCLFFILIYNNKNKKFEGQNVTVYLIVYGLIRFFIEGLRLDALMFFGVRVSQAVSMVLFILFSVVLVIKLRKESNKEINKDIDNDKENLSEKKS